MSPPLTTLNQIRSFLILSTVPLLTLVQNIRELCISATNNVLNIQTMSSTTLLPRGVISKREEDYSQLDTKKKSVTEVAQNQSSIREITKKSAKKMFLVLLKSSGI